MLFGLDLDTGDGVDDEDRSLNDAQCGAGVSQEVGEPGRVDEIDFVFCHSA